jgi:poly(A) polymerase
VEIPGVSPEILTLLTQLAGHRRLALVGGAVRDLLLHQVHQDPWSGVPDLDLVVEPCEDADGSVWSPAPMMARSLQMHLDRGFVVSFREHGVYGTVEIELLHRPPKVAEPVDLLLLDLATARQECYPIPAENPEVSFGSLDSDLARRDFSVNAIALLLPSLELLDPHGGQHDLAARELRLLHAHSIRDDPTRLFRAARYAARLGFRLSEDSLCQARSTLLTWPWHWRYGDDPAQAPAALGTRLRMELDLMLKREPWVLALHHLQDWGALMLLDPQLQADLTWCRRLHWAQRFGLPLIVALLAGASDPLALAERLQVPHRLHRLLVQWLELRKRLGEAAIDHDPDAARGWMPSRWCALLEAPGVSADAVALQLSCSEPHIRRPLLRWWARWRHIKSPVSARQLMEAGVPSGPALGQRINQLRAQYLDDVG